MTITQVLAEKECEQPGSQEKPRGATSERKSDCNARSFSGGREQCPEVGGGGA